VFLFIGVYSDPAMAKADLEVVRDLHGARIIGAYDAAVAVKETDGSIKMDKHERPTQHGAWTGIAAGAVIGLLFPPSIIGMAALGGVAGGLIGHLRGGMPRKDIEELGGLLETGQAALIVLSRDKLGEQMRQVGLMADKQVEKQIDLDAEELDKQIAAAEKELAAGM
jgi:uncharacterized membrane protein